MQCFQVTYPTPPVSSVEEVGWGEIMTKNSFTSTQFRFSNRMNFLKNYQREKGREGGRVKKMGERTQFSDLVGFHIKICDLQNIVQNARKLIYLLKLLIIEKTYVPNDEIYISRYQKTQSKQNLPPLKVKNIFLGIFLRYYT